MLPKPRGLIDPRSEGGNEVAGEEATAGPLGPGLEILDTEAP